MICKGDEASVKISDPQGCMKEQERILSAEVEDNQLQDNQIANRGLRWKEINQIENINLKWQ